MQQKKGGDVGRHIAAARQRAGLTQEELAGRLHVTRQTISNYESLRSQPDIQMLVQLSECLPGPVEELIYGPGSQQSPRAFDGLAVFCRLLGIGTYGISAFLGLRSGSGVQKVGENGVAFAFSLWEALPVWAGGLLIGTILLALSGILFRLGQRGAREEDVGR